MGQGRQHLIHRAIDIHLKDKYRSQKIEDAEGNRPVRECRNHKNKVWWDFAKSIPWHERQKEGQMGTMVGRKAREHEDMVTEMI